MATIEERVQALEHENTELKQKIELHTIAIGGLINKTMLEVLNEKNDKIFKALENHDKLTNVQLAELREKVEVDIEGKIVGMQTEMRQRFTQVEETQQEHTTKFIAIETTQQEHTTKFIAIETTQQEHTTRLDRMEGMLTQILARLPEKP
ncbi:MAG TPA: hypothetical protein VGM01_00540 [Ktedonobacteraceae bacterium]